MPAVSRAKKKSSAQASERRALVPQPHGGALLPGGTGKAGTGRPPSIIREQLRGSFQDRIGIIDAIADGKPMQRAQMPLAALIEHVVCANCGESQIAPKEPQNALLLQFDVQVSASPKDRLAALDLQAKYGLGALKEISVENVRERVRATVAIVREFCPPEVVERILPALRAAWA